VNPKTKSRRQDYEKHSTTNMTDRDKIIPTWMQQKYDKEKIPAATMKPHEFKSFTDVSVC
jgi:hypothetical protein